MRRFLLQWQVTGQCQKACKHCYISNEMRTGNSDMSLDECLGIIDQFKDFTTRSGVLGDVAFTGGDPLARKDFKDILAYTKASGLSAHVLGNPELLNDNNILMLKDNDVFRYQISLDGLKHTHDFLRGKGGFDMTLGAVKKLHDAGIEAVVMATVHPDNAHQMPELARISLLAGASRFDFGRLVSTGNGASLDVKPFTPKAYKGFLDMMYRAYNLMIAEGFDRKSFGVKEPLWNLYLWEKGKFALKNDGLVREGCIVGISGFCLDNDGALYGCRRLGVSEHNIKDTSFMKFFFDSKQMNDYREVKKIESCGDCELLNVCRGCRATAKDYFARDPQCWKE